ncbi:hypothetical protein NXT08_08025 [Rhodococcus pyridinivorans]|uniref:hypothetical protein n=1 Tax=Rhodococcus pyridinivorans TaxID=103816 RepID=UPI002164245A|nr:hypothetical protein [Rhodococcus pyridinivorans]UVT26515.1 hypothetical protein NXT08_08025 [Rhodococcus pyridinivorans]
MTDLELFLIVALMVENIALIVAHIVDRQVADRDGFGEDATIAMRRRPRLEHDHFTEALQAGRRRSP